MRVALTCLATGCLPYQAQSEDGGPNATPVIVDQVPPLPEAFDITVGAPQTLTVDIKDINVEQEIFVRVFRNDLPSIPVFNGSVAGGALVRKITMTDAGWCDLVPDTESRFFEVIAADGPYKADFGVDARVPVDGAEWSHFFWQATCHDAM